MLEFFVTIGSMIAAVMLTALMAYFIAPKDKLFSDATVMLLLCSAVLGALFPYHIIPALS